MLDHISLFLSRVGTLGLIWVLIAIVLAVAWRRPWLAFYVIASVATADMLANFIKLVVHRHRPFEHQIGPSERTHSFPSGHTATSFAAATALSYFAPRYRPAFYALAVLIGLSRLYNGVHYPTDVLAGAVLGVLVALGIERLTRLRVPRRGDTRR